MEKLPDRFLELKVYKNKKTGQNTIMLPKKKLGKVPKKIKVLKW